MTNKLSLLLRANKKIIENYFFMTIILFLNSFFTIIIYPLVIRSLGKESYGLYVFISSIVMYFIQFISFGFDMLGLREISRLPEDKYHKSSVYTNIFYCKIILEVVAILVFVAICFSYHVLSNNIDLAFSIFALTFSNILFPIWYFQGIQKMKLVGYIQVVCKLGSLPFIIYLIKSKEDVVLFSSILTFSTLIGAIYAAFYLFKYENIRIVGTSFKEILVYLKQASAFFITNLLIVSKTQIPNLIIGIRFGMSEVAIFDLALKIVSMPYVFFMSLSRAFFPKIMKNFQSSSIRKLLKIEKLLGVISIIGIISLGKFIIIMLGGKEMISAYYLGIILSFTTYFYLLSGVYLDLVLVPNGKEKYLVYNQFISFIVVILLIIIGLAIKNDLYIMAASLAIAALFEYYYLVYMTKKNNLLSS